MGVSSAGISPLQGHKDDVVRGSSTGERDLDYPSTAFTQAGDEEQGNTELDDDQFLVGSLLGRRVRRIRRRKVVQYLVKWKGYPDEENAWADEIDIHEDLIKDYESRKKLDMRKI